MEHHARTFESDLQGAQVTSLSLDQYERERKSSPKASGGSKGPKSDPNPRFAD